MPTRFPLIAAPNDPRRIILAAVFLLALVGRAAAEMVVPADLLDPGMFADASFGMRIESVQDGAVARVVTTGAEFLIDKAGSTIECRQRIGRQRPVAVLKLADGAIAGVRLTHTLSGAAIFAGGGATVRVNGDSLLMVAPGADGDIEATLAFNPDCHFEFEGNHNFFDPDGGVSFLEHGASPLSDAQLEADPLRVRWPWKRGNIFWAAVSPPHEFDWDASLRGGIIWYGSSFEPYPSDEQIAASARHVSGNGGILHIHSEIMLWKRWQSDLTPRNPQEMRRVIETAHRHGLRVIVYTTPSFFLKGTPRLREEVTEVGSGRMDNVVGGGSALNEHLYLEEVTRVIKTEMPSLDGLYLDGSYTAPDQQAAAYHLARSVRELVGDNRVLVLHASGAIGGTRTTCPAADTYLNMLVRGEGEETCVEPAYLRYFLSGYNVSNSIGVLVHFTPTIEQIDKVLNANARFPLPLHRPELMRYYQPLLGPALKERIVQHASRPTGVFQREIARSREVRARLAEQRERGKHLRGEDFILPALRQRGGYWRFEEPAGLRVFNSLAGRPEGAMDGGVARSEASFGQAVPRLSLPNRGCLDFDGQRGSSISIPLQGADDVGSDDFTLEAWIRPRTVTSRPTMVAGKAMSGISIPPDTGYVLNLLPHRTATGQARYFVQFAVCDSHGRRSDIFSVTSEELELERWHHIAGIRRGRQIELYIDGKLVATGAGPDGGNFSSDQPFTIGAGHAGTKGTYVYNFDGLIDEVRLTAGAALNPADLLIALDMGTQR